MKITHKKSVNASSVPNYGGAYKGDRLPGPGYYDPPEGPELTEHDDYQEEIILELDADIIIDEEGNWDYVDDKCMWASADDNRSADWYSEEYKGVYLVDHMGAVEKTDDLLMTLIPDTPGKHHISGEVHLFFTLSNIQSWTVDSGLDEDGHVWYEEEYDTDSIDTEFNYRKSYIKDFKYDAAVDAATIADGSAVLANNVTRISCNDLSDGYHIAEYSNGTVQVTKSRPYDDADYYWAKLDDSGEYWKYIYKGNIKQTSEVLHADIDEDAAVLVVPKLKALNAKVSPKMMHN